MLKKLFVCLSLLNIATYASEDGFDHKNETFGSVSDQKSQTDVVEHPDSQIAKAQSAETIELDPDRLKRLVSDFWFCAKNKDRLDDMKRIFFSIPEKQRSKAIKCRDSWQGMSPLVIASYFGNFEAVKFLVEHGADIYAVDKRGFDAFFWAKVIGYTEIEGYLDSQMDKDRNAENIEVDQATRNTILANKLWFYAKNKDRLDDMKSLLDSVPEEQRNEVINRPILRGMTPLMTAAFNGNSEGVEFLLEHGADIYAEDADGHNAYYWAERGGNKDVWEYLRSRMMG